MIVLAASLEMSLCVGGNKCNNTYRLQGQYSSLTCNPCEMLLDARVACVG